MSDDPHKLLDTDYGPHGAERLSRLIEEGADVNAFDGGESLLHVATRRRRLEAIETLLQAGASIDARNLHGKTAYAHAIRRGFEEIAELLESRGAETVLNAPDQLAVAIVRGRLEEAKELLHRHPLAIRTGNPEEDRLLADIAGRPASEPVALLIEAGADLAAPALDGGTPLHQAAWFGQPRNARLLIEAGAPLEHFDNAHFSSPLGWAVHGSRYSGGAAERQEAYTELVELCLAAGSSLKYPEGVKSAETSEPVDRDLYFARLIEDAAPKVQKILEAYHPGRNEPG